MKLISWNVNGLRACIQKGFLEQFDQFNADFFCLQETKLSEGQLELELPGYEQYWCYAEKKGYSGTAIFAKHKPLSVHYGLDVPELDNEGRLITLEYPEFYLVTCYTPNAQRELARIDHRMKWDDAFRTYLAKLDALKPVILCGDLNVAHQEIDLKNPKSNRGNAGFSDQERESFGKTLDQGFTDTFRYLHPDAIGCYSWWSYMFKAREKNAGWRIDYFLVSDRIRDTVYRAEIHSDIFGSDHCPVSIETDLPCHGGIFSPSSQGKARNLSQPDKTSNKEKASAVTAKAIVPFAAICILLCAVLLIGPIRSMLPGNTTPTTPTEEGTTGDLLQIHTYDQSPWKYIGRTNDPGNILIDGIVKINYVDRIFDGENTYYLPTTTITNFYTNNVMLRLELTEAAKDYGVQDLELEDLRLTQTIGGTIWGSMFPGDRPQVQQSDYYFIEYYLDHAHKELGGWVVLWNIPDSSTYTLSVTWEDDRFVHLQNLALTPAASQIPSEQDVGLQITHYTSCFPQVFENPTDFSMSSSTLTLGEDTFYSYVDTIGRQIQNATWWMLVTVDPALTDALPYEALTLKASAVETIPSSPTGHILFISPRIRPVYSDNDLTQQIGWLVYSDAECDLALTLQLKWMDSQQEYTEQYQDTLTPVLPDAVNLSTSDIVKRITQDQYLFYQLAYNDYGELTDIPLLRWLLNREDCVDALMNYEFDEEDPGASAAEMLLGIYEVNSRMTAEQKVRWLLSDYPASGSPMKDLSLVSDSDPSIYTTWELASILLGSTALHTELLHQCEEYAVQAVMLEQMRQLCPTLEEYLTREDFATVRNMMPEYRDYPQSIHAYVDLLLIPEEPKDMRTDQLISAIMENATLCDQILYTGPDFENEPYLQELVKRQDAVRSLMQFTASEAMDANFEIPYLLLSHPAIRYKMTPEEESDYLTCNYPSCPYTPVYDYDKGLELSYMSTPDLLAVILNNGDASLITRGSTEESRYLIFCYLTEYSPQLKELAFRTDALDAINQRLFSDPTSSYLDPTLLALQEIWPTVIVEYPFYGIEFPAID